MSTSLSSAIAKYLKWIYAISWGKRSKCCELSWCCWYECFSCVVEFYWYYPLMRIFANWWEEISKKMENTKVKGIGWQNASKDTSESWNIDRSMWCGWSVKVYHVPQKRRGNNLWFWAQKVKNSEYQISDFDKNCATKNRA